MSQYTFPVNERISTVTGNEYPVTGRGELGFKKSKVLQRLKKQKSKLALMDK